MGRSSQADRRPPPARRAPADLDATDRQLCDLLIGDPRATRRELAAAVGLTDETVAARLRALREKNVIATTVAVDWSVAGWQLGAIIRLAIRGDDLAEAAGPALEADDLIFAAVTSGCCDVVVGVLARNLSDVRAKLSGIRAVMYGAEVLATDVVVDALAYDVNNHTLPIDPWSADELPDPVVPLDDFDRSLIAELAVAGDDSNRAIARRLGVSDATVRTRLRRLEDAGLVRVVTARDPIISGDRLAHALAFVTLDDARASTELLAIAGLEACYISTGASDAVLAIAAPTQDELNRIVTTDLRRIAAVQRVDVAQVTNVLRHRTHLMRLL